MYLLEEVQVDHKELMWGQQLLLHSSEELEIWLLYNKQDLVLQQELWVSMKNNSTAKLSGTSQFCT
jgi:hypothetical protein